MGSSGSSVPRERFTLIDNEHLRTWELKLLMWFIWCAGWCQDIGDMPRSAELARMQVRCSSCFGALDCTPVVQLRDPLYAQAMKSWSALSVLGKVMMRLARPIGEEKSTTYSRTDITHIYFDGNHLGSLIESILCSTLLHSPAYVSIHL